MEENSQTASIYALLACIFATEVTSDFLDYLRTSRFREVLEELDLKFGNEFYNQQAEELLEELAVEYSSLFIGPGNFISPHESVHHIREDGDYGKLWGADTVAVNKFIRATGLTYTSDFGGMPDHISAELEFIQKIEEAIFKARTNGDEILATNLLEIKKRFFTEHIMPWMPSFLNKVEEKATLPFYSNFARLANRFLAAEQEQLLSSEEKAG